MTGGPDVTLTAIDPLDGYSANKERDVLTGEIASARTPEWKRAQFYLDANSWRLIQAATVDAREDEAMADRQYGLQVIDGGHSEVVRTDFELYRDLITPGGYVVFDNYDWPDWPDIKPHVDREILTHADVQLVGYSWRTTVVRVL